MAPRPVHAPKQPVKALHADVDALSWREGDEVTVEQLTACHAMLAANNWPDTSTLDWLADYGTDT